MTVPYWEFWIDVGGTFTDVFARRPDGSLLRHKVLSSGASPGAVAPGSNRWSVFDPQRTHDPDRFWNGATLILYDALGSVIDRATVQQFDSATGRMALDRSLASDPQPGQAYEITCGEEAPILAIRYLLGLPLGAPLPQIAVRLGTTRGTNALITRRGARTALVTTRGFRDILRIGYQNRPRLFDLAIKKHEPLFERVAEIDERVAATGEILRPLDPVQARRALLELKQQGIESLAICLLHSFRQPAHEAHLASIAAEIGFEEISISSQVAPLEKIVARGDTTVVDAYLNPVLRRYVASLRAALGDSDLRILTSAGGLVSADKFVGKDSILSGPAGGVVGFSRAAQAAGFSRAIGFDMGGTSTDVSRFDGRFEMEFETEKSGIRVVAPMLAIETVAAGGGSICRFDGVKLVVGPESAGSQPGPACYGRGGPLAVTDMNVYLGRIPAASFPFPLDRDIVAEQLRVLCTEIAAASGVCYSLEELAAGFLRVANANMVKAIQSISIAKGADPRQYVLVAFGGAAPQHACAVARQLGIRSVLNHPHAGILSAYGIGVADVVRHRVVGVYRPFSDEAVRDLESAFLEMTSDATADVAADVTAGASITAARALDLRYQGLDAQLTIAQPPTGDYRAAFEQEHQQLYGYLHVGRGLEIVAARVSATAQSSASLPRSRHAPGREVSSAEVVPAYFDGRIQSVPLFDRDQLQPGDAIVGPAIVREQLSTTVIESDWQAEVWSGGELMLFDHSEATSTAATTESDPVLLEIFNNHFAGIAERMGITLRNTSASVNVKERLDFSCAIFTARGELVVNAPHVPVHLGAMGLTVRRILADNPDLQPGDVYVTNDPYRGGSHLPDVTVVTPVHDAASGELVFFTASRAHHAEIGGIRPGSMPPFSRNLAEEGVLIQNFKLVDRGVPQFECLQELLLAGRYPTRNVADNLADVAAQSAANRQGAAELHELVARYSLPVVLAYMRHIQTAASQKMRRALAKLPDGRREFVDHLDDGATIAVAITKTGEQAVIDFAGTANVLATNLNANRAIVTAAVMYVLRLMIDEDIPLNEGVLEPVELRIPPGMLDPPPGRTAELTPAVAGGNVETSQRVVDVLLGALELAAASQGTMNNVLVGDSTFGYYETIAGGSGATPTSPGADAVQTHMTNTRLTDPEVLERRYPLRLREFSIRHGSGGAGRQPGGAGVVRRIEFLRELEVSLLASRRGPYPPYGIDGGGAGALGCNRLVRADGSEEELPGRAQFSARAGDVLSIETPGGGGAGSCSAGPDRDNPS